MRAGVRVGPFYASTDLGARRQSRDGTKAIGVVLLAPFAVAAIVLLGVWWLVAVIGGAVAALINHDGYLRNVQEIWNLVLGRTRLRLNVV